MKRRAVLLRRISCGRSPLVQHNVSKTPATARYVKGYIQLIVQNHGFPPHCILWAALKGTGPYANGNIVHEFRGISPPQFTFPSGKYRFGMPKPPVGRPSAAQIPKIITRQHLHPRPCTPICEMSYGTMGINALVINGSDSGAVPDDSTKHPSFADHGVETGSTNV